MSDARISDDLLDNIPALLGRGPGQYEWTYEEAEVWMLALIAEVRRSRAALERAEEVADQGCEFCAARVDDYGEERDGGREPHAHWWACGRCWNAGAQETSTIIGHLGDLLDRALERIPELERESEKWRTTAGQQLSRALRAEARAERVETAARRIVSRVRVGADLDPLVADLQAALAAAPAPGEVKGDG